MDVTIKEFEIDSLSSYVETITKNELTNYLFRGENKKFEMVNSKLLRNSDKLKERINITSYYQRIVDEYYREVGNKISAREDDNFLAFSQHHGLATNLIDFTRSPLIALYFACNKESYNDNETGYVYLVHEDNTLDCSELIAECCLPYGKKLNIFEAFSQGDEVIAEFIRQKLDSKFTNIDINRYLSENFEMIIQTLKSDSSKSVEAINSYLSYSTAVFNKISKGKIDDNEFDYVSLLNLPDFYTYAKDFIPFINPTLTGALSIISLLYLYLNDLHCECWSGNYDSQLPFPSFPYLFFKSPIKFDRIVNQDGVFIYQGFFNYVCENDQVESGLSIQEVRPEVIIKIINQEKILKQLDDFGINRKYIFGDYDNVAEYTNNKYLN